MYEFRKCSVSVTYYILCYNYSLYIACTISIKQTGHILMLMFISLVKIDEIHNREVNKQVNKCFIIYKNIVFPNHVLTYT